MLYFFYIYIANLHKMFYLYFKEMFEEKKHLWLFFFSKVVVSDIKQSEKNTNIVDK